MKQKNKVYCSVNTMTNQLSNKKAQVQHVFGFILIGIVIFSTLSLGLYFVLLLNNEGCVAKEHRLENKLLELSNTYDTYGTKQTISVSAPCAAEAICFINQDATASDMPPLTGVSGGIKKLLELAMDTPKPKPNVFLVRDDSITEVGTITKINVDGGALCVKAQYGAFELRVEGRGRSILIKE